jgi:uncharacterized membrane protein
MNKDQKNKEKSLSPKDNKNLSNSKSEESECIDFEKLPQEQQTMLLRSISEMSWQAPLPIPSHLREYEEILPGAADRIFSMVENQAKHRQQIEVENSKGFSSGFKRGQIFAFILASILIISGVALSFYGNNIGAGLCFGTSSVSLITAFLKRNSYISNNDEESEE